MTRIILNGYMGKLASAINALAAERGECSIVAGIDVKAAENPCFPTFTDIRDCKVDADVIIDCSIASVVDKVIDYALERKLPLLVCTTGLPQETIDRLAKASESIAVFRSANMSMGINLIADLLKKYSGMLDGAGFDIEIIEKHHNKKIDAPSGTALLLADAINSEADNKFGYVFDRTKVNEARGRKEIGIHSLRGGTIVGEHSVIFAGKDEVIEIKHTASSKEVFAVGALNAAMFLNGKEPGMYSMKDLFKNIG